MQLKMMGELVISKDCQNWANCLILFHIRKEYTCVSSGVKW